MDDRRYKILTFPTDEFADAAWSGIGMPPIAGMPEGYEVTGVSRHVFFLEGLVAVRVHHPSFPAVRPGHSPTPVPGKFVLPEPEPQPQPEPQPEQVSETEPASEVPPPPAEVVAEPTAPTPAPAEQPPTDQPPAETPAASA